MSDLSDNIAVLTHLKDKVHKWKNIAILGGALSLLFFIKLISGGEIGGASVESAGDYIANIKIEGEISEDDFRSEVLAKVLEEKSIKAVIIDINSPGGGIVGSEILFEELRAIAEKKPTVVVMGSLAASGGYMAAIASDHLIAHNGTLTGSIGVLMQSMEFTGLAEKVGVKFQNYKSAPLKASPSPFEKTNPWVDRAINESIKDSAEFFFDLVRERRGQKLDKAELPRIFDGRVFTGRQALRAGLVDEIGGRNEALNYLQDEQKIDTKSLKVREISVVKAGDNILDKFLGILPFSFGANSSASKRGMMAVME